MIIDRLVLKNFKRFKNEEIRFRDGITGILGNNGTGKSSIVQAIFFALYGVQATGIAADYIVSSFASPKERCEVRLEFRIGGDEYVVVRTFKKGKTVTHDAEFYKDKKLRAKGVSDVDAEVKRTLGMGPVDFRNTIYAAQKDLLVLLENTPGKRKEWFLKALGIDYLNTESQRILKERADAKAGELQSLEGKLEALAGRQDPEEFAVLQASVTEFGRTLQSLATRHKVTSEKKKALDEELRQLDLQKTEHTKLRERFASGEKEVHALTSQRTQVSAKLAGLTKMEPEFHALEKQVAIIPEKKKQFEILRMQKAEAGRLTIEERFAGQKTADLRKTEEKANAKILGLDRDAARIQSLITETATTLALGPEATVAIVESAVATCEEKIQHASGTLSARQNQLETEHQKILADFETIKTAGPEGTCPLCRRKLGTHVTEIEQEFEARIQEIQEEAAEVLHGVERIVGEKDKLTSVKPALAELRTLDANLKHRPDAEAELKEIRNQITAQQRTQKVLQVKIAELAFDEASFAAMEKEVAELEKTERKYNDLRANLAEVSHIKQQINNLETQVQERTTGLEKLRAEIANSPYDEKKGIALEQNRREIDTSLSTIETDSARTTERLRHAKEKIVQYKKAEAEIAGLKKLGDALKEEIELVKLTRSVIADYVIYLMQVVRSRIEGEVSRIISEITSGRYEQVLLDEDFNLLVRDIDNDYSIERFSGGEQDDIAVALRIALSRYLAELHNVHESTILIFDEIFGSQDEERRNNLLTTLRTQESRFPQIVLISHIQEMQGEFANTLMVEMGTDQSSRVKEVD